ncbi:uncharacterized protein LOC126842562 isoform X2 [Adelges cooleyi]|uniref:uncharacterized protein LOC126842562 isoform X2 n=1 Tax=Adelges cooleyi TaxID=133065 RepID=UPI0021809B2B|nr:uncharacterized protein LOC126842562 isoform X2 [Adelges cooleyi]
MKRFCVLLSFVVVNVLADTNELIDIWWSAVVNTNKQIQRVQCRDVRLIPVIKHFVAGDKSMTKIGGPNSNYETLQHSLDLEIELQTAITTLLGVPVPEEGRGLLRTAMKKVGCACGSTDYKNTHSMKIMNERKNLFRDATKLSIISTLRPDHEDFGNCNLMCRLKGLYRSIITDFYRYLVIKAEVIGDQCRLTRPDRKTITFNCFGDLKDHIRDDNWEFISDY